MSRNKPRGNGGRQSAKQMSMNRFKLFDEDIVSQYDNLIEEEEDASNSGYQPRQGGRRYEGAPGRRGGGGGPSYNSYEMKRVKQGKLSMAGNREAIHKVKIPRGSRYGMRFVLTSLISHVENLRPILPQITDDQSVEFYVKDADTAAACRTCHRRIKHLATGELLSVFVNSCMSPWNALRKDEVNIIQEVVTDRSSPATRSIDLSNFGTSEKFLAKDLKLVLTMNNVMLKVVELIDSKFSNIVALSLKGNRLRYLDSVAMLTYSTKQLAVLDISDNQIEEASELAKLRGLRITSIFLENNPLCEKYTRASDYLSAVHAVFPRVHQLDGNECAPLKSADQEDELTEPIARPVFYGPANVREVVERFVLEFFTNYDGDDSGKRKNLVAAYDDDSSSFTITINNLPDDSASSHRPSWKNDNYVHYIRSSHNIKQLEKWENYRSQRVFTGAIGIAAQLVNMPATRHLLDSFILDVSLNTGNVLSFTVQGLFEDSPFASSGSSPSLCFFSRNFVVVARPNGIAVISDELFLSALTKDRIERYHKQLGKANNAPPSEVAPTPQAAPGSALVLPVAPAEPDSATKTRMVAEFCAHSGMTREWSEKCLIDCSWNWESAAQAFVANRELIPKEAFGNP